MSVLVVTGASRGIGASVARLAAQKGWSVCINYSQSEQEAENVTTEIVNNGGTAISMQADVSSPKSVELLFTKVDAELGPVTGLVNNAAGMGSSGRVENLDVEATRRLLETNILGPFLCTRAAVRRMSTHFGGKGGSIVNVSSAAAKHGGAGHYVDYAASKAAIDTMTYGHAVEQADAGIRVNCVRPGVTWTEMNRRYMETDPEWAERTLVKVPLARGADVSEVANGIIWLLSDEASYVTGAILDISGGWVTP